MSVTEGAFAPIAIAATEAIVFITVLGKIIGERPAGPAVQEAPRELLARAEVAVLGADHDAEPGPDATPASSTASGTPRR